MTLFRGAACLAIAAACFLPSAAREKSETARPTLLPEWVKEAALRTDSAGDADLVWLHREEILEPLAEGGVLETRRYAAKILRASAVEELKTWTIVYRKEDRVRSHQVWSSRPDGPVRFPDPKEPVLDAPYSSEGALFEDSRKRILIAVAPTVGGIVAFESVVWRAFDPGAGSFTFGDVDRPTLFSRWTLRLGGGWKRDLVRLRAEGLDVQDGAEGVNVTAHDLPPLPREELPCAPQDRLPVVWAHWWREDGSRGFQDWNAVGRWYQELSAPVLRDPGESEQIAQRIRPAGEEGFKDSLLKAFDFAARAVRYVSIEIGIGGYRPHTPSEACRNRYGDCKDKAFLMRSLVEPWGTKTYPVLVATRSSGKLLAEVPALRFNHCIVAIAIPDSARKGLWPVVEVEGLGPLLLVDATAGRSSAWDLPTEDQGTLALLVLPAGGRLISLPVQPPSASGRFRSSTAAVTDAGVVAQGSLTERWKGASASAVREHYLGMSALEHRTDVQRDLQRKFPGAAISEYAIEGIETTESPVVEKTGFTGGILGTRTGDLLFVGPGGSATGIFAVKLPSGPRTGSLAIGMPREDTIEAVVELPSGWVPEEIPAGIRIDLPEIEARSEWSAEDGRLLYRRTAQLKGIEVPPDRYPAFREAVSRIGAEDARVVACVKR